MFFGSIKSLTAYAWREGGEMGFDFVRIMKSLRKKKNKEKTLNRTVAPSMRLYMSRRINSFEVMTHIRTVEEGHTSQVKVVVEIKTKSKGFIHNCSWS